MTRPSSTSTKPADIRSMTREEMIDASIVGALPRSSIRAMCQTTFAGKQSHLWQQYWHEELASIRANFIRIAAREGVR